jgi:hypothetical protein
VNEQPTLACGDDRRRERVRTAELYGLDYLEVGEDGRSLRVYFLGKVSQDLKDELEANERHVRIEGGRRVRDIEVRRVEVERREESDLDDYMTVRVDREGDFSGYVLRVVALENGRPTDRPMAGFDARYSGVEFNFKAGSPSGLDCKVNEVCTPPEYVEPEIDYLAKDYASFRQLILDRLALIMPDWQERHIPDVGVALVELLAYVGDYLSYYQDAVATEAYLQTARQRVSVRRHARLVDYHLHEGCNARAWVCIETNQPLLPLDPDDIAFLAVDEELVGADTVLTRDDLRGISPKQYEWFEPLLETRVALRPGDILHPTRLAHRLRGTEQQDSLSQYLAGQISEKLRRQLSEDPEPSPETLRRSLARELNHLLHTDILFGAQRFPAERLGQEGGEDKLEREIRDLVGRRPRGQEISRLNRLVLEDAYPEEIARSDLIYLREAHNRMSFYTWGERECCLPRGTTSATLRDHWVGEIPTEPSDEEDPPYQEQRQQEERYHEEPPELPEPARMLGLQEGDVLIFEETLGPETGTEADADRSHRHAVRLTRVEPGEDPLYQVGVRDDRRHFPTPVVEIEWAKEDALPFALCLSAVGSPPACELHEDISVARGNVVLADHGMTGDPEPLDRVPGPATIVRCEGEGLPQEVAGAPVRFRPRLEKGPLTFGQRLEPGAPAAGMLEQDPHSATPQVKRLVGARAARRDVDNVGWKARPDLLYSGEEDRHFAVEIDNDGHAWLRFGDGDLGRSPEPDTNFEATYRIGNGPSGNVGAEAISHFLFRRNPVNGGLTLKPRNPLPAQGGNAPETLDEAKTFAPYAARSELLRAVTAEDYARLAGEHQGVQRAAATLRWTGSWHEVVVAIDPLGEAQAGERLLQEIEEFLLPYRRVGHDVRVAAAQYVPLDLELLVRVRPTFLRGHVEGALRDLFSNRTLPDGRRGFFHPDEMSFGEAVYLSKIVARAQATAGVESVTVTRFQRLYERAQQEIETGLLTLGPLEIALLDNDPDRPENGRLRLEMRGGR